MTKVLRRLLAAILIVVLAVAAGTFIPRPLIAPARSEDAAAQIRILVLSNPIHTDIAIPLSDDNRAAFAFLGGAGIPVADPGAQWLVIGWGGRFLSGNADLGRPEATAGIPCVDDRQVGPARRCRERYR